MIPRRFFSLFSHFSIDIDNTGITYNIPSRTLTAGYYIVKLNAKIQGVNVEESVEKYIRINEEKIQAIISGGSYQMLPWQSDLYLNAGNSYDPNEVDPRLNLEYDWYCEHLIDGVRTGCFSEDPDKIKHVGSKWRIARRTLLEDEEYRIKLVAVNKRKSREAIAYQTIVLLDLEIPVVSLRLDIFLLKFIIYRLQISWLTSVR